MLKEKPGKLFNTVKPIMPDFEFVWKFKKTGDDYDDLTVQQVTFFTVLSNFYTSYDDSAQKPT